MTGVQTCALPICYETSAFNTTSCSWDVSGTQPAQPTLACYQTAVFNNTSCLWVVSGTQTTNTTTITASGSYTWPNNGQTYTSSGTYTGNTINCAIEVLNLTINPLTGGVLNLKVYLEGLYLPGGQMTSALFNSGVSTSSSVSDSVRVELRSSSAPNNTLLSVNTLLSTSGTSSIAIPASLVGGNYYIAVFHRNSVETWSSSSVVLGVSSSYDFSTSSSQAYSNGSISSMKQVEPGVWALYSGDYNQDGSITSLDLGAIATSAATFSFGYFNTDLTGDGAIDGFDLSIADNNSQALIVTAHP